MKRRLTVWLTLVLLAFSASRASAEDLVAPDGSLIRQTKLERACEAALTRFCPDLSDTPGQTRNEMICLKPYRTSLAPGCRAAVNAAMK